MRALKNNQNFTFIEIKTLSDIKLSGTPFLKDLFVIQDIHTSQCNHPEFPVLPACA
jgi:hypothetical protein